MKKLLAAVAALTVAALAACSGSGGSQSSASGGAQTAASPGAGGLDKVTWVDGSPPALEFDHPFGLDQVSA
ncbi:MAG: hypothetical protein LBU05_06905, partial [Bifidobacteriaceae bacterium]|nr:hypothetical protein [Bifidobacteriaceae bacterium]